MPATRAPIPPKPLVILNETEWSEESQSGGRRNGLRPEEIGNTTEVKQIN